MESYTKKVIKFGAGAVLACGGTLAFAMEFFYRLAFDRRLVLPDKLMMNEAQFARMKENRRTFAALAQTEVSITSFDGKKLVGHWITSPDAKRSLILVHGWRSGWDIDATGFATWQLSRGANLLLIEQRAQGQSEGTYMTYGIDEARDCRDWVNWLCSKCPNLPVYLFGTSMGASTVILALADKLPGQVRGVIADSAYTTPYGVLTYFGKKRFHVPEKPFMVILDRMARRRLGLDLKKVSTTDALKANADSARPLQVLLFQGTADGFVDYHMAYENLVAAGPYGRLELYEDVAHVCSYGKRTEDYQNAVEAFYSRCENEN